PVKVDLVLPNASLLPGVPFDMTIVYRNMTDAPISVGTLARIVVKAGESEPYKFEHGTHIQTGPSGSVIELQPRAVVYGWLTWDEEWFQNDQAFTVPGEYEISLELHAAQDDTENTTNYGGSIRSSAARLIRIEPKGEDAEVWTQMLEATNNRWPSMGF